MDDAASPDTPPSLAERIGAAARVAARREGRRQPQAPDEPVPRDGGFALALALLLPAAPLATWGAAAVAERQERAAIADVRQRSAGHLAELAVARVDATAWATAGARPAMAAVANGFARALPADDRLASLAVDAGGVLTAEVATNDPDALRAALRREPVLAGLRDDGQRQADGALLVRLRAR